MCTIRPSLFDYIYVSYFFFTFIFGIVVALLFLFQRVHLAILVEYIFILLIYFLLFNVCSFDCLHVTSVCLYGKVDSTLRYFTSFCYFVSIFLTKECCSPFFPFFFEFVRRIEDLINFAERIKPIDGLFVL